jgi:ATP-dependent Clp protease, protease subunit
LIIFGKCIQAKELEANSEYYIELLAKGTGKSKEEIAKDVQRTRYFQPQDAIEYGLADKIMYSMDGESAYEKRVRNIIDINLYLP